MAGSESLPIFDWVKAAGRRRPVPVDVMAYRPQDRLGGDQSAGAEIDDWQERQQVRDLLASLPERQRQVLTLRYEDFTIEEIARRLDSTESSVRTHLQLGRRAVRKELFPESSAPVRIPLQQRAPEIENESALERWPSSTKGDRRPSGSRPRSALRATKRSAWRQRFPRDRS